MESKKELEWVDYGYANGWDEDPERVKEAREKGYREVKTKIGDCLYERVCEELRYKYKVDTSG